MQTIFSKILPFKARGAKLALVSLLLFSFVLNHHAFAAETQATSIEGQIILSNQTIVANAAIYIADTSASSLLEPRHKSLLAHRLDDSLGKSTLPGAAQDNYNEDSSCRKPQISVLSFACSDETGHFNLALPSVPTLPLVVTIAKNGMSMNITIGLDDLGSDVGQIALDAAQLAEKLDRIAIVENVTPFVKSGLANQSIDLQNMDAQNIVAQNNGETAMDSEYLLGYGLDVIQSNVEYPGFAALFRDDDRDGRMDIFHYSTVLLKTSWKTVLSQIDANKRQILLDYVEQGGQLLITNKRQPKLTSIEGFI